MSLINDALQQARKSAPRHLPSTMQPLQPVAAQPAFLPAWFWTSLVTLLATGAVFFIGWAWLHRRAHHGVVQPRAVLAAPAVSTTSYPLARPPAATVLAAPLTRPPAVAGTSVPVTRPSAVAATSVPLTRPPAVTAAPAPVTRAPAAAVTSVPVAKPQPTPVARSPLPLNPPGAPKLQGIFYSPTAPSAVVDGKSVRPGSEFGEYRVKAISKATVTLIGPDNREFQISLGN